MQHAPVVLDDLLGDVEFACDRAGFAVPDGFGGRVLQWADEASGGFQACASFVPVADDAGAGLVAVEPVDELVHERAAFARVGHAPVDEDQPLRLVVESVRPVGEQGAAYAYVQAEDRVAHLPVGQSRQIGQRAGVRHAASSPSSSSLWSPV